MNTMTSEHHSNTSAHHGYVCDGEEPFETKFMPIFDERGWAIPLRAFLYLLALLYFFIGMKYCVDTLLEAVERITVRKVRYKDTAEVQTVPVWNESVKTLTLGALATGSPEIFISLIENICKFPRQYFISSNMLYY